MNSKSTWDNTDNTNLNMQRNLRGSFKSAFHFQITGFSRLLLLISYQECSTSESIPNVSRRKSLNSRGNDVHFISSLTPEALQSKIFKQQNFDEMLDFSETKNFQWTRFCNSMIA